MPNFSTDIVVYRTGAGFKTLDRLTGVEVYSGPLLTDAATAAFNLLTPGRTFKQTVLFNGDLITTGSIMVPSYTRVVIDGHIFVANGANCNAVALNNVDHSEVHGLVDGNKAHQSSGKHGVAVINSRNCRLDVETKNCSGSGVTVSGGSYLCQIKAKSYENLWCGVNGTAPHHHCTFDLEVHNNTRGLEFLPLNGAGGDPYDVNADIVRILGYCNAWQGYYNDNCHQVKLTNPTFEFNGQEGFKTYRAWANHFDGGRCLKNGKTGGVVYNGSGFKSLGVQYNHNGVLNDGAYYGLHNIVDNFAIANQRIDENDFADGERNEPSLGDPPPAEQTQWFGYYEELLNGGTLVGRQFRNNNATQCCPLIPGITPYGNKGPYDFFLGPERSAVSGNVGRTN